MAGCGAVLAGVPSLNQAASTPAYTSESLANAGVLNVKAFGATGDAQTIDSPATNRAIEAAAAAGGGTVYFPAGTYACYSIHLKSHVCLYLEQGATILAASIPLDGTTSGGYDDAEPQGPWEPYQDYGHNHWHNSLIWGEGIHDFSILGPGLIWGRGLSRGHAQDRDLPDTAKPGVGNKAIALKNCRNVILRDFSILFGGWFGILATGVDNLTIDNLKIDTNRDGVDIDCCRNVRVSNCTVNSPFDDAICPKSSFALGGPRPTENVTITNCFVTGGYELGTMLDGTYKRIGVDYSPDRHAARTGRIKFGTESNGGFKNIAISNCVIDYCGGLALESVDGAILEDVTISNLTMRDVVNAPIFIRLGARLRGPPESTTVGAIRRVNISDIIVVNSAARFAGLIAGIPGHDIEDVRINNVRIVYPGGGTLKHAATRPEEQTKEYPEPNRFRGMPAYGFFIRYVDGIEFNNVALSYEKQDMRPPFVLNDVKNAEFFHVKADHAPGRPNFILDNVQNFSTFQYLGLPDTKLENVQHEKF